ncbi:MAG: amidophosphoribosyltransferase, partial [Planctomycetota bacterium]
REELLAVRHDMDEIRDFLKVDSIAYQTLDGMLSSVSNPADHYCHACFSGEYSVKPDSQPDKFAMERT